MKYGGIRVDGLTVDAKTGISRYCIPVALCLLLLSCQGKTVDDNVTVRQIEIQYSRQITRLRELAQNFTVEYGGSALMQNSTERKKMKSLFSAPEILEAGVAGDVMDHGSVWGQCCLRSVFYRKPKVPTVTEAALDVGWGRTDSGSELPVLRYRAMIVESQTGEERTLRIIFDLKELESLLAKQQNLKDHKNSSEGKSLK